MFKPMLAWKPEKDQVLEVELAKLTVWPRLVSRKLDGIRATAQAGVLKSRTLKDIPNDAIQDMFKGLPAGLDGELIYGAPNAPDVFNKTSSVVMGNKPEHQQMAREGVKYYLFDYNFPANDRVPFVERYKALKAGIAHISTTHSEIPVVLVEHFLVKNLAEVLRFEEKWVMGEGFEGVMLRSLEGRYKEGRSTFNEGYLLKVKRFSDSEAVIIDAYEMMHNDNAAEVNELGRTKRSSAQENLRPAGVLGGFNVKDVATGVLFSIGSGFSALQKEQYWGERDSLVGKIIVYKSLKVGEIDKPRHPIFKGFRDKEDM
jgi:ATP-dependent DNA ligase